MRIPDINYLEPDNLDEALRLLEVYKNSVEVVAGGSDLLVQLKNRTSSASHLVDLHKIKSLNNIVFDSEKGLKLGATTTLLEIIRNEVIKENYPALVEAAEKVGAFQHQAMGTIGGNLCLNTRCWYFNQSARWRKARPICLKMGGDVCHVVPNSRDCYASYCGDTAGILIAYRAKAVVSKNGSQRIIPVEELFTGNGKQPISLESDEIITEIQVSAPKQGQKGVYLKLRQREAIDFPQVGVSLNTVWEGHNCIEARMVLTAVSPKPVIVDEVEKIIVGNAVDSQIITAFKEAAQNSGQPVANMAGGVRHRKKMLGIMAEKALKKVAP